METEIADPSRGLDAFCFRQTALAILFLAGVILSAGCDGFIRTRGMVKNDSGEPISEAAITIDLFDRPNFGKDPIAFSDKDGRFEIGAVFPGFDYATRLVKASKDGYRPTACEIRGNWPFPQDIEFILSPIGNDKDSIERRTSD